MELTPQDVEDILALLDSLPYDEFDLQTSRFHLTLRRTPAGWTQSTHHAQADGSEAGRSEERAGSMSHPPGYNRFDVTSIRAKDGTGDGGEGTGGTRGTEVNMGDAEDQEGIGGGRAQEGSGVEVGARTQGSAEAERDAEAEKDAEAERDAEFKGGAGVAVRAPLPGTFYRAPRPGAAAFVEVGSLVDEETVVGIVETMKLMNPVHAGVRGRVAEICVSNAELVPLDAVLMRIEADV